MFFTLYGCTRFGFVEGQHRVELTSRAIFGYRIDKLHIGIPFKDDPERAKKYTTSSSIYKIVGVSVVCDNTDDQEQLINLKALQALSRTAQDQSSASVSTAVINAFDKLFSDLAVQLENITFQCSFLGMDGERLRKLIQASGSFNNCLYHMICKSNTAYPLTIIEYVESSIHRLLILEKPFKNYIKSDQMHHNLRDQDERLKAAISLAKGSFGSWMYTASKKNDDDVTGRGPVATYHNSLMHLVCSGVSKGCRISCHPFDVQAFKERATAKHATFLVNRAATNSPYSSSLFSACLHYMVVDLTQYAICVPFVRDSYRGMVASISNASSHPVNDPIWFAMYILMPCKTIAEILLYHISKKHYLEKHVNVMDDAKISIISDGTSLTDFEKTNNNLGADCSTVHITHEGRLKTQRDLSKKLNSLFRRNMNAKACDPLCDLTLASFRKLSAAKSKITSLVYARALEMYFNLIAIHSRKQVLAENGSLINLRDGIVRLQMRQATENGKTNIFGERRDTFEA